MADENSSAASPFEGLLRPWFFPTLGLTAVFALGVFHAAGVISASTVGAVLAVVVPGALALAVLRPALSGGGDASTRALLVAAAILTFLVAALPALEAVRPGEPRAVAELSRSGEAQPLPPGVDGRVLLLVSTRLGAAAEAGVSFRLAGFEAPVEGELRRTSSLARVGRGGSARVSHDHDADWYEAALPAGAREIRLERVQGLAGAPLRVQIYREWIPRAWAWVLSLAVLALACLGEVRSRADAGVAIASGVALGFGLVVSHNVTPAQPIVPTLWAIVLGAIFGAPLGVLLRVAVRRLRPAPAATGKR